MPKFNTDQYITDAIIEAIERGNTLPWRKPHNVSSFTIQTPLRHDGEYYRGMNILLLIAAAYKGEYSSPYFMTYKQAQSLGAQVRKNEKGYKVIKFGTFDPKNEAKAPETEDSSKKRRPYLRAYTVFNLAQIEGLPEHYQQQREVEIITRHELHTYADAMSIPVIHGHSHGAYIRVGKEQESIRLPNLEDYPNEDAYIATYFHELIHATGHEKRLDRLQRHPSDEEEAFEELVAEIGSTLLCNRFGISTDADKRHIPYIAHWLQYLRSDTKFIRKAASEAQKAIDLILALDTGNSTQTAHLSVIV